MKTVCACAQQNLKVMDYLSPLFGIGKKKKIINRVCLVCGMHWHGEAGNARAYTRKEWDELMEGAA